MEDFFGVDEGEGLTSSRETSGFSSVISTLTNRRDRTGVIAGEVCSSLTRFLGVDCGTGVVDDPTIGSRSTGSALIGVEV